MSEKICKCGEKMKCEGYEENEPLIVYRCLNCSSVEFEEVNGYEG